MTEPAKIEQVVSERITSLVVHMVKDHGWNYASAGVCLHAVADAIMDLVQEPLRTQLAYVIVEKLKERFNAKAN